MEIKKLVDDIFNAFMIAQENPSSISPQIAALMSCVDEHMNETSATNFKVVLENKLMQNEALQSTLLPLVNAINNTTHYKNISDSKNVISDSDIKAGKDVNIGNEENNTFINDAGIVSFGNLTINGENVAGRDMTINKDKDKE